MFEILFTQSASLARHRAAPHAAAREQFLEDCANRGYSYAMLRKIAWILLTVASQIHLDRSKVSLANIERAVEKRARFLRRRQSADGFHWSRQMFIHFIIEWLRSLGCTVCKPAVRHRFSKQLNLFSRYMHDECGLSSVTIATRCGQLTSFFEYLPSSCNSVRRITIADIDAFIENKGHQGWTRASLSTLASSLRAFFRYAQTQDWCLSGLAAVIDSPRIYAMEDIPRGPDWEEVQRLLAITNSSRHVDIRDRAILLLLSLYGLRRSEVAALCLDDIDWVNDRILITRSKQRRKQCYPLIPEVGNAILRYLQDARPRCVHRALFLALAAPVRPLSATSITAVAHARLTALDIKLPSRGAHCLRHACASHLQASGFSLKQIGDHLGHRSASSTLAYTKVDLLGLRQVAEIDLRSLL
jgi:site-specific recombinase XerD